MIIALVIISGLVWGSFLNMFAYRLLSGDSLLISRSFCPSCKKAVAWHDLVPVFSYLFLKGRCRSCFNSISYLYPLIEICAAFAAVVVWYDYQAVVLPTPHYAFARAASFSLLYSGLLVATRTDLDAMVIPRFVTAGLAGLGVLAAALGVLAPVTLKLSIIGGVIGYGLLWLLGHAYKKAAGRQGVGEGDMELLGVIGLFFGPIGVWGVLLVSSIVGSLSAIAYLVMTGQGRNTRIPFGPFLSLATLVYLHYYDWFISYLLAS